MSITGIDIFARVITKGGLGIYIPDTDIDDLSANLLTSTLWLRNSSWGSNQHQSQTQIIYRPVAAAATDRIRYIANSSTDIGAVVPDSAWGDVAKTDEAFFILDNGVHPMFVIDAMNRAMGRCYTENSDPLSILLDAGFQSPITSYWTESDADGGAATTFSKVSTIGSVNVYPGFLRSGRVLNSAGGAGGYIRQRFYVHRNQVVHLGALVRPSVGTAALVLWDVTNDVIIDEAITYNGRQWAYLWNDFTVPSDCDEVEVRLRGEENSADIYWNACWAWRDSDQRIELSSTWDSEFKIPSLAAASFGANVAGSVNVAAGFSLDLNEIDSGSYGFQFNREAPAPGVIQFHNPRRAFQGGRALFVQGRRAYSDFTIFTIALTETTSGDLDLIDAMSRIEAFKDSRISSRTMNSDIRLADAWGEMLDAKKQFQQRGPADRKARFVMPRAAN